MLGRRSIAKCPCSTAVVCVYAVMHLPPIVCVGRYALFCVVSIATRLCKQDLICEWARVVRRGGSSSVRRAVCQDLERADPDFAAPPSDAGVVVVDQAFYTSVSISFNHFFFACRSLPG